MSVRLSIQEAETRHPDLVTGQRWHGAKGVYEYHCEIHGNYPQIFYSHERSKRCPKCSIESGNLSRTQTHDGFVSDLKLKSPHITVIGRYVNAHTVILCICELCGHGTNGDWTPEPTNLLNPKSKGGCPKCAGHALLTMEEAERRFPDMEKEQKWIGAGEMYWFICERHGRYPQAFSAHSSGKGCPECSGHRKLTIEDAERRCPDMAKGQRWRGVGNKYWFVCSTHGRYPQVFSKHYGGHECPRCRGYGRTIKEVEKMFPDMVKGQRWRGVGTNKISEKYWFECPKHGPYHQSFSNHQTGNRCPTCKESLGERAVRDWLDTREYGDTFERQKQFETCRSKKNRFLPFDFGSDELMILIEYHGYQHYHPVNAWGGVKSLHGVQKRDRIKKNWTHRNGYKLIVIPHTVKNIAGYLEKRLGNILPAALPIAA